MATRPAVKPRIQSVARAVSVLNAIARSPAGLTAQELSVATGLSRATTYHLVQTLVAVGYITSGPEHRYRLGVGISPLVEAFGRHVVPQDLLPLARSLAQRTGETAYVAAREGADRVSVSNSPVGPIEHGHARASGKLLLAFAPDDARERYLAAHPLTRMTKSTITTRDQLLTELAHIREHGWACDLEEYHDGVCCFAAPLAGGAAPYALVLSAPKARFEAHREEYLDAVLRTAAEWQ